jgi:AICAR transformylase/IMP cyclohydrolase PurH
LGGVALARTAAKASLLYDRVTILISPNQYEPFLDEMGKNNGDTTHKFKLSNAIFAFEKTSYYDKFIRERFSGLARALT